MTREELLEIICPTDKIVRCCSGDCSFNCDDCNATMEHILDIYEHQIRADEREEIIRIIEECAWRDADMLVELIKEQNSYRRGL